jgi:hypothetical protein
MRIAIMNRLTGSGTIERLDIIALEVSLSEPT